MITTHAIVKVEVREDDLDSEAYRADVTCSCGSRMGVFWVGSPAEVLVHVQTYFDRIHVYKMCEAESVPALLRDLHTVIIKRCGLPDGHDGAHYDFAQRRRWRDEERRVREVGRFDG